MGLTVSRDVTFFMQNWPLTALPESTDPQSWSLSTGNAWITNINAEDAASSAYLTIHCISGPAVLVNHGFWGIPIEMGQGYELVMYLKSPDSCQVCTHASSKHLALCLSTGKPIPISLRR